MRDAGADFCSAHRAGTQRKLAQYGLAIGLMRLVAYSPENPIFTSLLDAVAIIIYWVTASVYYGELFTPDSQLLKSLEDVAKIRYF